ncbi:DUF418 domain-containing protein [Candidatus Poribacteria bacterium]|nr:DUF418 domain-containing protein [Candidatus Poribacteria bacterium]
MQTRIAGYDFARSLPLFGLVAVSFTHNWSQADFYLLDADSQGWVTTTFLVLAGIGMSLLRQRDQNTNPSHRSAVSRKRLIKRAALLLVVGICCNLIWETYFLCYYSICIVIGTLLLTASDRWLWSLALIFALIWAACIAWTFGYPDVAFNMYEDSQPWTAEGTAFRLDIYRFHSIFFWTGSLLIGVWLGRWKVHDLRVRRGMFFGGIIVALVWAFIPWLLARFIPLSVWESAGETIRWLLMPIFLPLHFFGIWGIATAIIGGSLMLTEKYPDAIWTKPFIETGQLALTFYVAHLVIGKWLLKELESLDIIYPVGIDNAVIFCICAVIFSHFWRKGFEHGPIEWALRRVTG